MGIALQTRHQVRRPVIWATAASAVAAAALIAAPVPGRAGAAAPTAVTVGTRRTDTDVCGYRGCREHGEMVKIMTRNIYLGADLGPAFRASGAAGFVKANGEILRQVAASNMPARSKGLAREIKQTKPDIVGLQEAALWRTGPVDFDAALKQKPIATKVYQDFIQLLMRHLNSNKKRYRVAYVTKEFDFEGPADTDDNPNTGPLGADENGRLTMRDAILVRRHQHVRIRAEEGNHYSDANLFKVEVAGLVNVKVFRGWQSLKVSVRESPWFRYSNTHLEAFDDRTEQPSIRAREAQELVDHVKRGPHPNIVSGDFNSDSPGLVPGDEQAYDVMIRNGYRSVGTKHPLSCCIKDSYDLTTGTKADFDHRVDQIFTSTPKRVLKVSSAVPGRAKHNGYWDSDHAGVVSKLFIFRKSGVR